MLSNVVFVSTARQSDQLSVYTSPLSWISFPFKSPHSTEQSFPVLCSRFSSVICFIRSSNSAYMLISILPVHPPSLSSLVSICLFSLSVSLFLLCKSVHLYHFFYVSHLCVNIQYLFFPSDLLHSICQSLGPSMAANGTISFLFRA